MVASYSKLPKSIQDYHSGLQSVNQLRDNLIADFDAAAVEHGTMERVIDTSGSTIPPATKILGHHDTPKVPRAVVRVSLSTGSFTVTTSGRITVPPVVTSVVRFGTGGYIIGVQGLEEFYGEIEVEQTAQSSERLALARSSFGTPFGIIVELYEKASIGGGFDLVDTDFACHIYGTVA